MVNALRQTVILGTTTNLDFLIELLESEAFRQATITTRTLDEHLDEFLSPMPDLPDLALVAAALHDLTHTKVTSSAVSSEQGDPYSPWNVMDGWRG
jgi:acetyl/propionyl-CoA carboxylase alpha subunit